MARVRAGSKAADLDLDVPQGEDWFQDFIFEDDNGDAVTLTGATIRGQIREAHDSASVVATFTGTILDAAAGKFRIALPDTTTAGLAVDSSGDCKRKLTCYIYDVEVVYVSGDIERLLQGVVYVSPEVTKI